MRAVTLFCFLALGAAPLAAAPSLSHAQDLLKKGLWTEAVQEAREVLKGEKPDGKTGKAARIVLCEARSHLPEEPLPEAREVGGSLSRPVKIAGNPPRVPDNMVPVRRPGSVVLDAVIDQEGCVLHPTVAQGPSDSFAQAAAEALRSWTFLPSLENNQPVAVKYQVTVSYGPTRIPPPPR